MYGFVLGKTPELSIAELGAVIGTDSKNPLEVSKNGKLAFSNRVPDLLVQNPQAFLNRLGGTTEILEIFARSIPLPKVEDTIFDFLKKKWEGASGKHNFGLNLLPENKRSHALKLLLKTIKKKLRAEGIHANFMNNNFMNVSPVFAQKSGFIREGGNITIVDEGEGMASLGVTLALQDFEGYSKRDYSKPFRDSRVGMLPPKLAQMMVNLAADKDASNEITIVDPFCGTATLLMEAMLTSRNVIGFDADERMAQGADKNIEWLRHEFKISPNVKSAIDCAPAQNLSKSMKEFKGKSLAIATEPHMGPPVLRLPSDEAIQKTVRDLTSLYLKVFEQIKIFARPGTRIVFIFPYFRTSQKGKIRVSEQLVDKIKALGYSVSVFDPLGTTSLFYERPDQIVGREIMRFLIPG